MIKTLEELKDELKDNFDEFMYQSNIEMVKKIDKTIEKLSLLLDDLKINKEVEQATGRNYFNADLFAIRVKTILKILNGEFDDE